MKYILILLLSIPLISFSQAFKCLELDNIQNIQSSKTLNDDFQSHRVILIGEAPHMMPANTFLQTELLIYLNANFGTKTLLMEWGHSDAYLINKYLETGDMGYFNRGSHGFRNLIEAQEAIQKLYSYNDTVSQEKKVKFVGLDFEREPALTSAVYFFLKDFHDEPSLKKLTDSVKERYDTVEFDFTEPLINYLRDEMPKYEHILSRSPDWHQIQDIVYFESSYEDFWSRDKYMMERFSGLPTNERYLGFFGTNHTRINEPVVFAGMLNNDSNYNNEILVINLHHENSFYKPNVPIEYAFLNDIGFFKKKNIKRYLSYYNSLSDCQIFISKVEPIDKGFQKIKDKCDYVIFIRNQMGYTKGTNKEPNQTLDDN